MSHKKFVESLEQRYLMASPLGAPTTLKVTASSSTAVAMKWVDNATAELGFKIERSTDGGVTFLQVNTVAPNVTTYTNGKLTTGKSYYYRVRAYDAVANSAFSNRALGIPQVAPSNNPIPAPTSMKATAGSTTAITLTWTDNAVNESGYKIERSTDGTTFKEINAIGPNQKTYTNGKLSPATKYYFRVRAYNPSGNGAYSAVVSATTKGATGTPPSAPSNLKATSSSATGITLTWKDNSNREDGYKIERSIDGTTFKELNAVGTNATSYANGKLTTGTKYYYRVYAFNGAGNSSYSNVSSATPVVPPTSAPKGVNAPTGMKAVSSSATAITVTWVDNATAETGFKIERGTDGVTFQEINTIGANQTTYTNGKLSTGVKYYFRVRAYNPSGNGGYSTVVSATPIVAPDLAAPTTPKAAATSPTTVKLTWVDVANNEWGYKIERGTDGVNFTQIASTTNNTTVYGDNNLLTGTKYYYRVRAYDETRFSTYTEVVNATPKAGAVADPKDLPPVTTTAPDFANGGVADYKTDRWFFDGVSVTHAADPAQVIPILKALHVGSIRTWFNTTESWDPVGGNGIEHAKAYKDAGFRVMMVIGDDRVPTYDEAKTFFKYVKNYPDALKSVDLWEIGNEPNRPNFWKGTASEYVNIVLKAAWDILHPAGAKVVGAGATFDVNYCRTLVEAGYLNYVDYANFHPYGSTPEEVYQRALGAKQVFAGRPLLFSEWNIRNTSAKDAWVAKNNATRKLLATVGADSSFYFTFVVANTLAGPSGLINLPDLSVNEPFYSMFKQWGEEPIVP